MDHYTDEIQLVNVDGMTDFERTDSSLRALIVSLEGTLPGSRGFGLSGNAADMPPEEARNMFLSELDEKVEQFIPGISIADVEFGMGDSGVEALRIYVEQDDEEEEGDDD